MDTRNLPVALTQDELDLRRDRLAELVQSIRTEEAAKASAAKMAKDAIERLETELMKIAQEIREKAEYRDVSVSKIKNYERRVLEIYRDDTGQVIDSRPLEAHELQRELPALTVVPTDHAAKDPTVS